MCSAIETMMLELEIPQFVNIYTDYRGRAHSDMHWNAQKSCGLLK